MRKEHAQFLPSLFADIVETQKVLQYELVFDCCIPSHNKKKSICGKKKSFKEMSILALISHSVQIQVQVF